MATAKKLPSGNYRIQVFDYKDADGKNHYKSFTHKNKKMAEFLASQYLTGRKKEIADITIEKAVRSYIDAKRNVLSPTTIRGYETTLKSQFKAIYDLSLKEIDQIKIQAWVNQIALNLSPKTVANAHGLLVAVLDMFIPDVKIKTRLPAKKKPNLYVPTDSDIKKLLDYVKGKELEIAILLAAFGPMRRGEICALESTDITDNIITVNKSLVRLPDGGWIVKAPKTYSSNRIIEYPDFVIEKLKGIKGKIITTTPDQITNRFVRAIEFSGSPKFRFHDLRHYSASIMHAIGVPDQYIMERGGWASDRVLKDIYRNTISDQSNKFNQKINSYFASVSHEISHDK